MSVKDIIILACEFTENQSLGQALENNSVLDEEQSEICDSLVKCFNLVNNEVASEYIPIVKWQRVSTTNFKVEYSSLSSKVLHIISVRDSLGRKVKFKAYDSYLMAFANTVDIIYQAEPAELAIDSEFYSTLPNRIYAYGIAREYYFQQTLFDEADIWEERFKNTLSIMARKRSETHIPKRRWL